MRPRTLIASLVALTVAIAAIAAVRWYRQNDQRPDTDFDLSVATPAYAGSASRTVRVAVDRAHNNFHTATGRYEPFAHLLANDGYRVTSSDRPFDAPHALDSVDVLVVANAMGWWLPRGARAARPAFRDAEVAAVRDWVLRGGSLLLVSDHYPAGEAARGLAAAFGVEMRGGYLVDTKHQAPNAGSPTWIVYDRAQGLGEHPIIAGRSSSERLLRIVAFTGQSLSVPSGAAALLRCDTTAFDAMRDGRDLSARGRAQAVALAYGKGRVVITGEAAMLTAQTTGGGRLHFGMNWPNTDDKQFALNIAHWLSHLM